MKRLAIILCLPSIITAGDQSPVNWQKLEKQYHVVQELEKRLAELEEAHRNLQRKISEQAQEALAAQKHLDDLDPQSILYKIATAPLHELEAKQQQDTQQCELTATAAKQTAQELEREVLYATDLKMRDQKEKLVGVAQRVQEREQRNQHNKDTKRDGIPTALANAKRGGPESTPQAKLAQAVHSSTDTADKAIQDLFNNVRILEEKVWHFGQKLTQEANTTEPAPKDEALALLLHLQDNITTLKADLGKMVLAAHPDAQERQTYLATLTSEPSPSATRDTLSDAQKIKRSASNARMSIIIPIITIRR